ncbi:MAG: colanic acid biosynthesis glycosyltransferase WcaL, partial [Proteobacteria bacterium]
MGLCLRLFSLRLPTDDTIHPIHREIHASVVYLPEYALRETWRVLGGLWYAVRRLRFGRAAATWLRDLARDPTPNRVRRFAQALVLAREFPADCQAIYAHFMHTPGSVARYAALLLDRPWAFSAHAKDIWTLPEWEKREKL